MRAFRTLAVLLALVCPLFAQNATPAAPPPFSSEINSRLPAWLRFGGEERVRMESIGGQGFKPIRDLYLLQRLRLNLNVKPTTWLLFVLQAEDSRVFGQNAQPAPASQKDAIDLRLGYAQIGAAEGPASLRLGRQSLDFGEGRLLADPNWSNVGRSFDAARLTLHRGHVKLDVFSGASVKIDPVAIDEPTPGEHLHGAYATLSNFVPGAVIEPYVLWRLEHGIKNEAGKSGNLDEKTAGLRFAGKLPIGFDYSTEAAFQTGDWAGDAIGAWMGHAAAGKVFDVQGRPRLYLEINRASGDQAMKDGRHGAFDSLFPSSHDKFGLTDLFCFTNILYLRSGVQLTLRPNFTLGVAYNDYWLASAADALYSSGKAIARSATPAPTHVGQGADVQAQWTLRSATSIQVGYGRLFPGAFLESATTSAAYNILFTSVGQRF